MSKEGRTKTSIEESPQKLSNHSCSKFIGMTEQLTPKAKLETSEIENAEEQSQC